MKTVCTVSVLMIVVLLAACATLPPPEKGNGTLLVTVVKLQSSEPYWLSYEFGLKETSQRIPINPKTGISVFDRLPPGTYTIDRVYTMSGPTMGGATYSGTADPRPVRPVSFTLSEGTISILPVSLIVTMEWPRPNSFFQRWTFVPTNRDEALAELAKYDNFDRWRVAP